MLFVFATYPTTFWTPTPSEKSLSDEMIGYVTRFAKNGDPNGGNSVKWPAYDPQADSHLVLDDSIAMGEKLHSTECDVWSAL